MGGAAPSLEKFHIDTQFHETISNCVLTWKHASLAHFPDTLKLGMKQGLEGKTRVQTNS
jgi:hypothetical protein